MHTNSGNICDKIISHSMNNPLGQFLKKKKKIENFELGTVGLLWHAVQF